MKFKVGDMVRGKSDKYTVTNRDMTLGEVMSVEPFGIKIKILEHTNKSYIGKVYWAIISEEHFELVEEKEMSKLETLEKKYKELGEEIERLKSEKENELGKPEHGDAYWFISHSGEVKPSIWYGDVTDEIRYELGNVFKTEEEAEFKVEQIKVEAELRRFSKPFALDEQNYSIYFDHRRNMVRIDHYYFVQSNNIVFDSKEIAQKAIDTVGTDRIKKYYFGVGD